MIQSLLHSQAIQGKVGLKWLSSPVMCYQGSLEEISAHIPSFERRAFVLQQGGGEKSRLNERLDTIVRLPFDGDETVMPVGIVSKDYTLGPHRSVLDEAIKALEDANIVLSDVKAELRITEYGERMALSLYLPEKYSFDPGDGHPMALRLECLNSVDGSTRFRALMGWFRLVCSNGLVLGVTRSQIHRRHVGNSHVRDIGIVLIWGLYESEYEKENLKRWTETPIGLERLARWSEDDLRREWGFKAATRAFHIACTGADVEVVGRYKGSTPTTISVRRTRAVPGAPNRSQNLYDVSQVLAWLARERRDIRDQLEWRQRIPALMDSLIKCTLGE